MTSRDNERLFDYVIVGAGTAGCVLANRLSEDKAIRVCLIEAGPKDGHPFIHVPALVGAALAEPGLGLLDSAAAIPEWTEDSNSAGASPWRFELDQRHGLYARQSQGL